MPTSTKPAGSFASNFNPGSSGKNINKGNKPTSFAQKMSKKQSPALSASKKALSSKLSAAAAVSNAKVVKKGKLSSTIASSTGSSNLSPPSPIKKGVAHPSNNTNMTSNKGVQVASPHREPSANTEQFPPLSPKTNGTPTSPLAGKKLDYCNALKSGTASLVASSSSEDTMEKMLSKELKKDKSKADEVDESGVTDSSSESTENSKHKRHLTKIWKELKEKRPQQPDQTNRPASKLSPPLKANPLSPLLVTAVPKVLLTPLKTGKP